VLGRNSVAGGTYGAAASAGGAAILTEAGEVGQLTEENVQIHLRGCRNVAHYLGIVPGAPESTGPVQVLADYQWLRASHSGCWYPAVRAGEKVQDGQVVGTIKDYFGNVLVTYTTPAPGIVLFSVTSLAMNEGDPLLAIGVE